MGKGSQTRGPGGCEHAVAAFVGHTHAELDTLADAPVWSLTGEELATTLTELTRAKTRLAELELRVLAQADRVSVGDPTGAVDTPAWWACSTRLTRAEARRLSRLARSLDARHEPVRAAMALGDVLPDQAQVIVDAIDALPSDLLDPETTRAAQEHLIGCAREYDAKALRILGRRILEVVAPQVAEEYERTLLAAEETAARQAASLTISHDGHGKCYGRFTLPTLQGQMLTKALTAIANPARNPAQNPAHDVPVARPLRMGHAFMDYIERFPSDRLPEAGGCSATVMVTMTLDSLITGLGVASLDTGTVISAGQARRLAATAGVIPAVLGTDSEVLDLGRKARLFTTAQRRALAASQPGCTADGCDWPPAMCHAHHDHPWSAGGPTDLHNGRLLCPRHHARAHDPGYACVVTAGNKLSFHRRT